MIDYPSIVIGLPSAFRVLRCSGSAIAVGVFVLSSCPAQEDEPHSLKGRVEDGGQPTRLSRPQPSSALGQSVKILPGYSYNHQPRPFLQSSTDDDSLGLSLKTDNFKLPGYKPLVPKSDWLPERSAEATLKANKRRCNPCLTKDEIWTYLPAADDEQLLRLLQMRHGRRRNWPPPPDWTLRQEQLSARLGESEIDSQLSPLSSSNFDFSPPAQTLPALPRLQLPDMSVPQWASTGPQYEDKFVMWDPWYAQVADGLWKKWKATAKAEPGEADLRITVSKSGIVQAQILSTTTPSATFKSGLLSAAKALSASPILVFPSRSQRSSITFDSHFTAGTDTVSGAQSQRNDVEHSRVMSKH